MKPCLPRAVVRVLLLFAVCLGLWGCAAQQAFRDGQSRATRGDLTQALQSFEQAQRLEPDSLEYRAAVERTRERLLTQRLGRADQALAQSQLIAAEQLYREVLAQAPGHDRAQQGLRAIERQRRFDQVLPRAEAAAGAREWEQVRTLLRPLQVEAPQHKRVGELLQQADAALSQEPGSAAELALAAAYRRPISIEFRDSPLRTIFEVISRSSGLNFVFDKDVRSDQRASIFLKNATIETAVNMLLVSNQLEQRVLDPNSVLIYPNTPQKQKEHQSLVVRSFYLANADAKSMAVTLKTLLKTREAVVDERLNLVVVRDTPEAVRLAAKLVALHDLPDAEVMLEVEVLEIKRTRLFDLGVRWPDQLSLSPLPGASGVLTLNDLRNLNNSNVGAVVGGVGISARDNETDAKLLANPRIRARNREKARIHIGERVPNITTTSTSSGFVSESVTYVDVGLKLDVEPTINLDNEVAIKVGLEVSSIISQITTKSGTLAYQIGTRTATTVLRLKDGENQVLAGLINDEDRRSANKVPGLGDVPVLGRLFGNQADDNAKTEIVLSITPRVLRNLQRPDAAAQLFDSGSESAAGGGGGAAPAQTVPRSGTVRPTPPTPAPAPGTPVTTPPPASTTPNPVSSGTSPVGTAPVVVGGGATTPAAAPLRLRWQAPATVRVGESFNVQLLASSDEPLTALSLQVALDPQVMQLVSVTEGPFLRQGGGTSSFSSRVEASTGQLSINASRTGGSGAASEAVLLSLSLRAAARPADGQTTLQLAGAAPLGLQGRALSFQALAPQVITVQP
jgi:general secretion pathway protein D